jgi:ABC-type polysaccharide/polyol phosphate export permease
MTPAAQVRRLLGLYWAVERGQATYVAFNALLMPAMLAYFGVRLLGPSHPGLTDWIAASTTFAICMHCFAQMGFNLLHDRFLGRLELIRSCGVNRGPYCVAQVVLAIADVALVSTAGLGIFSIMGLARPNARSWLSLPILWVTAGSCVGGLGATISFRCRSFESGNVWIFLASLCLALVSPVFYSVELIPGALRWVMYLSPVTHVAPLMRAVFSGESLPHRALAGALVLGVLFYLLAFRSVRWRT